MNGMNLFLLYLAFSLDWFFVKGRFLIDNINTKSFPVKKKKKTSFFKVLTCSKILIHTKEKKREKKMSQ